MYARLMGSQGLQVGDNNVQVSLYVREPADNREAGTGGESAG